MATVLLTPIPKIHMRAWNISKDHDFPLVFCKFELSFSQFFVGGGFNSKLVGFSWE